MSRTPPMPSCPIGHFTGTCTISVQESSNGAQGGYAPAETSTISDVPCYLRRMSVAEVAAYGKREDRVYSMLYVNEQKNDNSGRLVIKSIDRVLIEGVYYEVEGPARPTGDSGVQAVPVSEAAR